MCWINEWISDKLMRTIDLMHGWLVECMMWFKLYGLCVCMVEYMVLIFIVRMHGIDGWVHGVGLTIIVVMALMVEYMVLGW